MDISSFSFKKLFGQADNSNGADNIVIDSEDRKTGETYKTWGFRVAGRAGGNNSVLTSALNVVEQNNIKEQIGDLQQQQTRKNQLQSEIGALNLSKDQLSNKKDSILKDIDSINDKIGELKDECSDAVTNFEKQKQEIKNGATGTNRTTKLTLIIACVLLLALSIYLFTFYSSAIFSAFFKEFTIDDTGLGSTILDSKALSKAWEQGAQAGLFCSLLPFVFVALGFVVSQFEIEEGWKGLVKTFLIYAITFVFDAILAYGISEKVYNLKGLTQIESLPEYTISMASKDIDFWSIIFLGFIVYIIFGLVFGFAMKKYDDLTDRIGQLKMIDKDIAKTKEICDRKLQDQDKKLNEKKELLDQTESQLLTVKQDISSKESQLNGNLIDFNNLNNALNQFFMGWMQYLSGSDSASSIKTLAKHIFDNKIAQVNQVISPQKKDELLDQLTLKNE